MTVHPVYCFDSSSLFEAWNRSYRPGSFPTFWKKMEELVAANRLVICEEVRTEIRDDTNALFAWVTAQPGIVVEFDRSQELVVKQVMADFPRIVNIKRGKGWADPFVIALAKTRGHMVVTEEGPGALEGPKIPYICKEYGVACINLVSMIEEESWRF